MTPIATPNGLAIAGALFMLSGLAILGAALLNRTTLAQFAQSSLLSADKLHTSATFALPIVALGLFLQAAGNLAPMSLGTGLSCLLLALALGLFLFLMLDETIAESVAQRQTVFVSSSRQATFSLPPPATSDVAPPSVAATCEKSDIGHAA